MAAPITWQNVNQGDSTTAWRGLDSAQRSLNGVFTGLGDVIKQREDIDAGNVAIMGKNNTQPYLDKVTELGKTPEALQAAIADGSLDRLKASYGPNIDHAAVRGAADALLTTRYAQSKAATDFAHFSQDEKDAPARDQIGKLIATGKFDEANALMNVHPDMRNQAALASALDNRQEVGKERVREQGKFDLFGVRQKADISNMEGTLANARAMTGVAGRQAAVAEGRLGLERTDMTMRQQDRLNDQLAKATEGLGKARAQDASTAEGTEAVMKQIETTFGDDKSGAQNARQAFREIVRANPGITTAAALGAISTQDNSRFWKLDAWERSKTADYAKELANSPEALLRQKAMGLQADAARENYARARTAAMAGPTALLNQAAARTVPAATTPPDRDSPTEWPPGETGRAALTRAGTAVGDNTAAIAAKNAAYLASLAGPNSPVAAQVVPATVASPNLGGPRVAPPGVNPVLPTILGDKDSAVSKFMRQNGKLEQAAAAAKLAADTDLADKVAKAKTAKQVEALIEASKSVLRDDPNYGR